MATRNIVPRADGEGSLGTLLKNWLSGFFKWINIAQYIDFSNISTPSHKEGRIFYDNIDHVLAIYNESAEVVHNLGQEHLIRVKNETGETISNGKVVKIFGSNGLGSPLINLALADTEDNATVLGLTTSTILDENYGYVCACGKVHGLDTSMFLSGDIVYLSSTVPGGLTTIKPPIVTIIGRVLTSHLTEGIAYIFPKELGAVSADMLKSVYDTDNNGIVDKAESIDDEIHSATAEDIEDAVNKKHEHSEYYGESLLESSTTSQYPNYINKLSLNVTPIAGDYILEWNFQLANSGAGGDNYYKVHNGVVTYAEARTNQTLSYTNMGWIEISGFVKITLTEINTNFYLDFCRQTNTAYIKNAKLLLRRII